MNFASPLALLLFAVLPFILYARRRFRRNTPAVSFPSTGMFKGVPRSFRQRMSVIQPILIVAALGGVITALARPRFGMEEIRDIRQGIAIEMVIDRSGSMAAWIRYGGRRVSRLDAVKGVFLSFIQGREDDLVGLIAFARFADTVYPLSVHHETMEEFLQRVEIAGTAQEDGTAIGDALALAAARLKTIDVGSGGTRGGDSYDIKSRVIILLTDGQNNSGKRTPAEAAELAREWGIKVYCIGIGGGINRRTLEYIADTTGGEYFEATEVRDLEMVYRTIDALEKSEIESTLYVDYREGFVTFAVFGLCALFLFLLGEMTVFRRIP